MNENTLKKQFQSFQKLIQSDNNKAILIKDGFWSLLINGMNKILILVVGILMIRILGREQYGIYTYFLAFVSILIIPVEFGVSNLVVRETARSKSINKVEPIKGLWQWSSRLTFWVSMFLISIILIGLFTWGRARLSAYQQLTLLWTLPLILFQSLMHLSNAALRGMKKIILGQLPEIIIIPALFIVLFIISSLIWVDVLSAAFAMGIRVFSTLIALLVSLIFLFKNIPSGIINSKPIFDNKYWLLSVIPLGLSTGLAMIKSHASVLIMGIFVDPAQLASYQVAVSAAGFTVLVLQSANMLLAPYFASMYAKQEKLKLQKLVTISARLVLAFNLIISLIFLLFGKHILTIVFGADTVDAYPALLVLLVGQLVNSFIGSVAFLLNMTGHEKEVMVIVGSTTILNIILTFLLTPHYGIVGGAIAHAVTLAIAQIAMFFAVRKRMGIVCNAIGR